MPRPVLLRLSLFLIVLLTAAFFCDFAAAEADAFRLKSADLMDKTFDFLIALSLALFAIVGYLLKNGFSEAPTARCCQIIALLLFVVGDSFSLFCGYKARLNLASILASGGFPFNSVNTWYVWQAVSVLVSGLFAFIVIGLALNWPAKPRAGGP